MTDETQTVIPTWILWYGAVVAAAVPLILGVMTLVGPNLGSVALADGGQVDTGLFKYGIRNVAAGVAMAIAVYLRSAAMLVVLFVMRFITEAGDLLDSILFGGLDAMSILAYSALMIVVGFVPYTLAIRRLWPQVRP